MEQIRGLLMDEMDDTDSVGQILSNSSMKVIYLISLLRNHLKVLGPELKALIFVTRRHTAKNIHHIIQKCSELDSEFAIRSDFMVGNSNSIPDSIDQVLQNKWNRKVLDRFRKNEINTIVSTSVLEEGIDLQMCNLVIMYDMPKEFRAYIQSKGRARVRGSTYIILCPDDSLSSFQEKLREWNEVDETLKSVSITIPSANVLLFEFRFYLQYLIGKTLDRPEPTYEDIVDEFADRLIPKFQTPKGAVLERTSAIQLLNRYCQTMPNDMFTKSKVTWRSEKTMVGLVVTLLLPIQSVVKDPVSVSRGTFWGRTFIFQKILAIREIEAVANRSFASVSFIE